MEKRDTAITCKGLTKILIVFVMVVNLVCQSERVMFDERLFYMFLWSSFG